MMMKRIILLWMLAMLVIVTACGNSQATPAAGAEGTTALIEKEPQPAKMVVYSGSEISEDKELSKSTYCYDAAGNEISSETVVNAVDENGKAYTVTNSVEKEYNSDNLLAKLTQHVDGLEYALVTEYEYDSKGNLTKEISLGPDGNAALTKEYSYDSADKIAEVLHRQADGTVWITDTYTYSENATELRSVMTAAGNAFAGAEKHEYDANGNETAVIYLNEDGSEQSKTTYEYDNQNCKVKETQESDGTCVYRVVYEYGEDGACVKELRYEGNSETVLTTTVYTY